MVDFPKTLVSNIEGCSMFWNLNLKKKTLAYLEHISTSSILLAYDWLEGPVRIKEDLTIAVKGT